MQFVVVLISVIFTVVNAQLTLEQLQKLAAYRKECMAQTGVGEDAVKNAAKGVVAEDDPKLQEHLLCVFRKANFVDDSDKVQREVLKQKLTDVSKDAALAEQIVEECAVEKETPQLTVVANYKCFYQKTNIPVV